MESYGRVALLMRSGYVKRWHREVDVPPQNVAEHSWRVAIICLEVFGLHESVNALYHDVDEVYTGDVPATTKWASPQIKQTLGELSRDWQERTGIRTQPNYMTDEEYCLFKVCDWTEAALYCLEQLEVGNKSDRIARTFYRLVYHSEDKAQEIENGELRAKAVQWIATLAIHWEELEGKVYAKENLTND